MDSRQRIKEEFTYYLSNIARSSRRTDKGFNLQPTAVQSFLAFLEVDRLFDYNPEIWKHIKIYCCPLKLFIQNKLGLTLLTKYQPF